MTYWELLEVTSNINSSIFVDFELSYAVPFWWKKWKMQHLSACDVSLLSTSLAGGIFYDFVYTGLASSGSYLNKVEQHFRKNATNILIRISIWILLGRYKISCDVTNAMTSSFLTSYQLTPTYLKNIALKFFQIDPIKSITEISLKMTVMQLIRTILYVQTNVNAIKRIKQKLKISNKDIA